MILSSGEAIKVLQQDGCLVQVLYTGGVDIWALMGDNRYYYFNAKDPTDYGSFALKQIKEYFKSYGTVRVFRIPRDFIYLCGGEYVEMLAMRKTESR